MDSTTYTGSGTEEIWTQFQDPSFQGVYPFDPLGPLFSASDDSSPTLPTLSMLETLDFSSSMAFTFPITTSFSSTQASTPSSSSSSSSSSSASSSSTASHASPPHPDTTSVDGDEVTKRRTKQNQASQEYRKRKRKRMEDLEQKVQSLTAQLDEAKKELVRFQQMDLSEILKPGVPIQKAIEEGRSILLFIETALQEAPSNESRLQYLLHLFWNNIELIIVHGQREIERFLDPFMQIKHGMFGFGITTRQSPSMRLIPSAPWWKEFCAEIGVSQATLDQIDNIMVTTERSLDALLLERQEIHRSITDLLFSMRKSPHHVNMGPPRVKIFPNQEAPASATPRPEALTQVAVEIKQKNDMLLSNFVTAFRLILSTHRQMGAFLTPREHATILMRAYGSQHYDTSYHRAVEQVRALWKASCRPQGTPTAGMPTNS
eukprot:TRINITY_DN18_c3_g1_i1.p1 TRINITY_DN18_c3_g1~~TRINITY_DN18_c3_g1_i1.p1  ORF type:complete len:432 (+),score=104.33 TRINITY_DN18_c3_g1_i1:200-1495(+)